MKAVNLKYKYIFASLCLLVAFFSGYHLKQLYGSNHRQKIYFSCLLILWRRNRSWKIRRTDKTGVQEAENRTYIWSVLQEWWVWTGEWDFLSARSLLKNCRDVWE